MATTKFTITLDDDQFEALKQLVAAGHAPSVSAFVRKAVETALNDVADWKKMIDETLEVTGGPMTDAEREWADRILGNLPPKPKAKK